MANSSVRPFFPTRRAGTRRRCPRCQKGNSPARPQHTAPAVTPTRGNTGEPSHPMHQPDPRGATDGYPMWQTPWLLSMGGRRGFVLQDLQE